VDETEIVSLPLTGFRAPFNFSFLGTSEDKVRANNPNFYGNRGATFGRAFPLLQENYISIFLDTFLGAFTKLRRETGSFVMSVCPSAWNS
jgi:hypothetical protein